MMTDNDELAEYEKKSLLERMKYGIATDRSADLNTSRLLRPICEVGFSHGPDEDLIRDETEKSVEKIRVLAGRNQIRGKIKKETEKMAQDMMFWIKHELAKGTEANSTIIVMQIGLPVTRYSLSYKEKVAGRISHDLMDMASRYLTRAEYVELYELASPKWVRFVNYDLTQDEIREEVEEMAQELLGFVSRDLTQDEIKVLTKNVIQKLMPHVDKQKNRTDELSSKIKTPTSLSIEQEYLHQRSQAWQVRRLINKTLLDNSKFDMRIIKLLEPVLINMLNQHSTIKDWNQISSNDRQPRRTSESYPYMISTSVGLHAKQNKDRRIKSMTTSYTKPKFGKGGYEKATDFDMRVFADAAYIKRERKFWEGALEILSKWWKHRSDTELKSLQNRDLIYHIINNDVALHILFDNLSLQCELKHFTEKQMCHISYNDHKCIMEPCCEDEINTRVKDILTRHEHVDNSIHRYIFKTKNNKTWAAFITNDDDGTSRCAWVKRISVPDPFTRDSVKEAITELEKFIDNFPKKVEGAELKNFSIATNTMKERIGEFIIESALALKAEPDGSPRKPLPGEIDTESEQEYHEYSNRWKWVCKEFVCRGWNSGSYTALPKN